MIEGNNGQNKLYIIECERNMCLNTLRFIVLLPCYFIVFLLILVSLHHLYSDHFSNVIMSARSECQIDHRIFQIHRLLAAVECVQPLGGLRLEQTHDICNLKERSFKITPVLSFGNGNQGYFFCFFH